jgi:DNA-binding MarR family transcriptional regulator
VPHDPSATAELLGETAPAIMDVVREGVRQAKRSDLTLPQLRCLGYVHRHDGSSLAQVASHVGLSSPAMSQMVDGLVERKLLRRTIASDDRRRVRLCLTPAGRAQVADARAGAHAHLTRLLARLSPVDLQKLHEGLVAAQAALTLEASP